MELNLLNNIACALFGSTLLLIISVFGLALGIPEYGYTVMFMFPHALAILIGGLFYWAYCFKPKENNEIYARRNVVMVHLALVFCVYFAWSNLFPNEAYVNELFSSTTLDNALRLITVLILAPISEEILFRGIVFDSISRINRSKIMPIVAAVISSFVFMVNHTQYENASTSVLIFLVGMLLCSARFFSNTLWIPMVIHSFASLCAILL